MRPVTSSPLRRVYCDFHGLVDEDTYALDTRGSIEGLEQLGETAKVGLHLTFWMDDGDDDDNRDDLLVDGVLDRLDPWGWVARVDASTWRHDSDERHV